MFVVKMEKVTHPSIEPFRSGFHSEFFPVVMDGDSGIARLHENTILVHFKKYLIFL